MKSRDSLQGKQQKTKAGSASSQRSPSVVLVVGQSEHKLSVFSQVFLLSASQAFILQKYTVNIYRYKIANGNTGVIPTTSKSYWEFLKPLQVIYQKIYLQRLKKFLIQAKGFAGSWNDTGISISLYSFVPIDIYSEGQARLFQ